jgi:hypothetical protein
VREINSKNFGTLSEGALRKAVARHRLKLPAIPNISHWFRWYVVVDLARLRKAIQTLRAPASHKAFFMACFGSIIRNMSNADPRPVSGLKVTAHMKPKDAAAQGQTAQIPSGLGWAPRFLPNRCVVHSSLEYTNQVRQR